MKLEEVLNRIGYVRNKANLSARELSLRMGMSPQYISKIEGGYITLSVEKLLDILEICEFPIERFFSPNIESYTEDKQLISLINSLPLNKKKSVLELL